MEIPQPMPSAPHSPGPALTKVTETVGSTFKEDWVVEATTVDGRHLVFDIETGELR